MRTLRAAVIVLTWSQRDPTFNCLASLARLDYPTYELVVTANNSDDDTAKQVETLYPNATLLVNQTS
jgi:GT2 family glycosyltransferase